MNLLALLRRLLAIPGYRLLFLMRVFTQAADGTLQVGMASYILFSPESQPNAGAIATVLAITLLPFSLVGPFVSVLLDRWSRRQTAVVVDYLRAAIALAVAGIVVTGHRTHASQLVLYVLLLAALSLNRFLLAGLAAALSHVVEREDYLNGSSLMPMIGPLGVLAGAGAAGAIRLVGARWMATYHADAIVFCLAALLWVVAATLALRFPRNALGPDRSEEPVAPGSSVREVWSGLADAVRHLRTRTPASLALTTIFFQRIGFGMLTVAVILMYRNYFHQQTQVNGAIAGFGAWALATGIGFVLSATLVPPLTRRLGLRATASLLLALSAVAQFFPGLIFRPWAVVVTGFFIGWFAQSFKICTDTLVQAHVDPAYKGRTFVIYDGIFNLSMVVAAVLAIFVLPSTGASHPVFIGVGVMYLVLAAAFWVVSGRVGQAQFNEGTELG